MGKMKKRLISIVAALTLILSQGFGVSAEATDVLQNGQSISTDNGNVIDMGPYIKQSIDKKKTETANALSVQKPIQRRITNNARSISNSNNSFEENLFKTGASPNANDFVPDKLIIKYKKDATIEAKQSVMASIGATSVGKENSIGISSVMLKSGANIQNMIEKIKNNPSIEFVEPEYYSKASTVESPNDPIYSNGWQWGLNSTSIQNRWAQVSMEQRASVTI